ncbi:MAG: hypothetical protein J5J04_10770 [Anaerolineae bacterium]|nr:hypothetical protein [Anaerolineae bacterium]
MSDQLPPLPSPWAYVYVWRTQSGAFHRSFSANYYNGVPCDDQELAFTADQMHAYARAAQAMAYERAAQACEDKRVDAERTGDVSDRAYNAACLHCADAIRALKGEQK